MLGIRVASDTQYLRAVCPAHLVRRAVNLKVDTRAQANMHTHFLLLQPKVENEHEPISTFSLQNNALRSNMLTGWQTKNLHSPAHQAHHIEKYTSMNSFLLCQCTPTRNSNARIGQKTVMLLVPSSFAGCRFQVAGCRLLVAGCCCCCCCCSVVVAVVVALLLLLLVVVADANR